MDAIVAVGGGGHAKVVLGILKKLKRYRIVGYTDLHDRGKVLGVPYLGSDGDLASLSAREESLKAVLAVGQVSVGITRHEIWTRVNSPALCFPAIVSPDAIVNEEVSIGNSAVVMDGAVINCGAMIGQGAIVNTDSTIEHDVVISDWVHVAPGATISGGTNIGRYSMVGAGATVIEGISITEGCIIGAGAVVVRDLTIAGTYVGCPAHRIK
jgi:sugar O-acyltransferase (sialic acid O-acetyltransferase NeuD family)